ncbi:MAG: hypothetical protein IJR82_05075 [Bacilli bacterium]|nr:hypothetical protein [Bacilli bacterium]
MEFSYFTYGINDIKVNPNNKNIIDIQYGYNKIPLHIFKDDIPDFIKSLISKKEREQTQLALEDIISINVEQLDILLKGRCIILITGFSDYSEYNNISHNEIKYITSLNINGQFNFQDAFDYMNRTPSLDDLNKSSNGPTIK